MGSPHLFNLHPAGAGLGVLAGPPAPHRVAEASAEPFVVEAERRSRLSGWGSAGGGLGSPLAALHLLPGARRGVGRRTGHAGGGAELLPEAAGGGGTSVAGLGGGGGAAGQVGVAAGGGGGRGGGGRRGGGGGGGGPAGQEEALEAGGIGQEEEGPEAEREQAGEEKQKQELLRQPQPQRRRPARHARQLPQQHHEAPDRGHRAGSAATPGRAAGFCGERLWGAPPAPPAGAGAFSGDRRRVTRGWLRSGLRRAAPPLPRVLAREAGRERSGASESPVPA